jgi:hypothetical protein
MQLKDLFYGVLFVVTGMILFSCSNDEHSTVLVPADSTNVTKDSIPQEPADSSVAPKSIEEMIVGIWELIDEFPSKTNDIEFTFSSDSAFSCVQNGRTTTGIYAVYKEDERYYEKNKDSAYMHTADNQYLPYSHYVHIVDYEKGKIDFGILFIDGMLYLSRVHVYTKIPQKYIFQRKKES